MRRLLALGLAVALAAGPAVAQLQPKPAPPPRIFLSPSGEPFRLGPDMPDPLAAWFAGADTGHLGYLDRAEFRADAARFFKTLDANGDGMVDGFEVQAYETKIVPELADWSEGIGEGPAPGAGEHPGGGGHGRHEGGGHGGEHQGGEHPGGDAAHPPRGQRIAQLINEPEPVSDADFNFDSHITPDEWMRAADQRFDLLDKAQTGKLTLDALRAILSPPPRSQRGTAASPPPPPPAGRP